MWGDQVAVVALTDMHHLVGVLVLAGSHFAVASDEGAMERNRQLFCRLKYP